MTKAIKKYSGIILGAALAAVALDLFLVPAKLAPGGVSGISTIIYHKLGLPIGILIFAINVPIFIAGLVKFGLKFTLNSLVGMMAFSVFADVFAFITPITEDLLLSSVFGGILMGVGFGLVFLNDGTTGGTDIAAKFLQTKFPNLSIGRLILALDVLVITAAGLVFWQWETILYSSITLFLSSRLLDTTLEGVDFAKMALIISDKHADISQSIFSVLGRGVTGFNASSPYTGDGKNVLMCVIRKNEIYDLKALIKKIDPMAFVILSDVKEVLGYGFKL